MNLQRYSLEGSKHTINTPENIVVFKTSMLTKK